MSLDGEKVQSVLKTGLAEYVEFYIHRDHLQEVADICKEHSYSCEAHNLGVRKPNVFVTIRRISEGQ